MYMDKLRWDLELLLALKRQGVIRDFDYSVNGIDNWVAIFGAFPLPADKFSYPDANIKLPIPDDLYEPSSNGKLHWYGVIFIDAKLRRRAGKKWMPIARQLPHMNERESKKGWSFLCVIPHDASEYTDIRAILPIIQDFILTNGEQRR